MALARSLLMLAALPEDANHSMSQNLSWYSAFLAAASRFETVM